MIRPEHPPHAARALVLVGALLLIASLFMPWWGVRLGVGGEGHLFGVRPFEVHDLTWEPAVMATGVLVAAAVLLLFVRQAGQSWHHEPRRFVRDLWISFALVLAAIVLVVAWPDAYPRFWGGISYPGNATPNGTPVTFHESAAPRIGWWTAIVAAGLLGWAARSATRWWRGDDAGAR